MHDKHVHDARHLRACAVLPVWLAHIPEPAQHRDLRMHAHHHMSAAEQTSLVHS